MDKKLIEIENKIRNFLLNDLKNTIEEEKYLTHEDIEDFCKYKEFIEKAKFKDLLEEFDEDKLENVLDEEEIEYLRKKGLIDW